MTDRCAAFYSLILLNIIGFASMDDTEKYQYYKAVFDVWWGFIIWLEGVL